MSNGWFSDEHVLAGGKAVAASLTAEPVSDEFRITAEGSCRIAVAVVASAVTGTVDLILQTNYSGEWVTSKATTIAAAGTAYIKMLSEASADQAALPLGVKCRVVATTGVGEAITVSSVKVLQPK